VPLNTPPQHAFGVDGAHAELQHKLPVTDTEADGADSI